MLFPVNVHAGGTDGGSGAGSGNACLAALEEEGTSWVVAGLGECGAGSGGVGWQRYSSRFACLSLTVSRCYKSERSIEDREGKYLTRGAEFVRSTKELSVALGEGRGL